MVRGDGWLDLGRARADEDGERVSDKVTHGVWSTTGSMHICEI